VPVLYNSTQSAVDAEENSLITNTAFTFSGKAKINIEMAVKKTKNLLIRLTN
jgi:hypothetical protein